MNAKRKIPNGFFPWLLVAILLIAFLFSSDVDRRPRYHLLGRAVAFAVRWIVVPAVVRDEHGEAVARTPDDNEYSDAFQEHLSHNQPPTRAISENGDAVIDHGHGW